MNTSALRHSTISNAPCNTAIFYPPLRQSPSKVHRPDKSRPQTLALNIGFTHSAENRNLSNQRDDKECCSLPRLLTQQQKNTAVCRLFVLRSGSVCSARKEFYTRPKAWFGAAAAVDKFQPMRAFPLSTRSGSHCVPELAYNPRVGLPS